MQLCCVHCVQCADLDQLIDRNKDIMSAGYDTASKVWTGLEIVAQLELMGLTAAKFTQLQVIRHIIYHTFIIYHILYTVSGNKKRPQYFRHNFDKLGHSFVIFGTNHPDTSTY